MAFPRAVLRVSKGSKLRVASGEPRRVDVAACGGSIEVYQPRCGPTKNSSSRGISGTSIENWVARGACIPGRESTALSR